MNDQSWWYITRNVKLNRPPKDIQAVMTNPDHPSDIYQLLDGFLQIAELNDPDVVEEKLRGLEKLDYYAAAGNPYQHGVFAYQTGILLPDDIKRELTDFRVLIPNRRGGRPLNTMNNRNITLADLDIPDVGVQKLIGGSQEHWGIVRDHARVYGGTVGDEGSLLDKLYSGDGIEKIIKELQPRDETTSELRGASGEQKG